MELADSDEEKEEDGEEEMVGETAKGKSGETGQEGGGASETDTSTGENGPDGEDMEPKPGEDGDEQNPDPKAGTLVSIMSLLVTYLLILSILKSMDAPAINAVASESVPIF